MDQEYGRSASISHAGGTEDLDFKDLTEQINDYEKALNERIQAYHEGKLMRVKRGIKMVKTVLAISIFFVTFKPTFFTNCLFFLEQNEDRYSQIQQMIGKFGWLSKIALEKGQEQEQNIQELNSMIQEKEQ